MIESNETHHRFEQVAALLEADTLPKWLPRASMGVLTVDQFLALVLYVISNDETDDAAEAAIVSAWSDELRRCIDEGTDISPRSPVTLLPLPHKVGSLDGWVFAVEEADWFLRDRHMAWSCAEIIAHLHGDGSQQVQSSPPASDQTALRTSVEEWTGERLCQLEDELRKKGCRDYTKQMVKETGLQERRIRALKAEWRKSLQPQATGVGRLVQVLGGKRR